MAKLIESKRNGKLTKRAKIARLYKSICNGRSNRHAMSYLERMTGLDEDGLISLLNWFRDNHGVCYSRTGRSITFIAMI